MSFTRKLEARLGVIQIPFNVVPTKPYAAVVKHYGREMVPEKLLEKGPVSFDEWWWR